MKTPVIGRNDHCPYGSGKKFKHCCMGKENKTASGHGAGVMSELLHKAVEGRQFNSLEEAQTFLDQITQQQNRRQLDEFHGLSPEQMSLRRYCGSNLATGDQLIASNRKG